MRRASFTDEPAAAERASLARVPTGGEPRATLFLLLVVGVFGGCGGASSSKGASLERSSDASAPSGGSREPGTGGSSSGSGGSSGRAGSSGSTGTGGSSASGGSGAGGAAGGVPLPVPDAGGAADARPQGGADASAARDGGAPAGASPDAGVPRDGGPPPCSVALVPVPPGRLIGSPAGPNTRLRMRGEVAGTPPRMTVWTFSVRHETAGPVPTTRIPPEASDPPTVLQFEFPLERPGRYTIQAGASPTCQNTETATAIEPNQRQATYFLRVIPPMGSGLPPQELRDVQVFAIRGGARDIQLQRGTQVSIDPRDSRSVSLPSYVRISSPRSTLLFEGHTGARAFELPLDPQIPYDVLVVPDAPAAPATPFPPALWTARRPLELGALTFTLGTGVPVEGKVRDGQGMPIEGARVLLRTGALTSTIATTAADGTYALRVSPGSYNAFVLPPRNSTLPEVQLEPGNTVDVDPTHTMIPMDLNYESPPQTRLDVTVTGAGGRAMRVRLESRPGTLPTAATLTVEGGDSPTLGRVLVERVTDGAGRVTFSQLPRVKYRVTVLPDEVDPALGVTSLDLDLGGAGATVTRTVPVGRRLTIGGRLDPAATSAQRQVLAVDMGSDVAGVTYRSTVAADGRFALELDPGRSYRLFLEPPADRRLPRVPLGPLVTGTSNRTLDPVTVAAGSALSGTVTQARSPMPGAPLVREPVPGVFIQAYCMGAPPDCIDESAPSLETARPLGEAVSDDRGAFQLNVPDPAFTNF